MKVALCYDRINKFGGAERVLLALHELWPDADVFTLTFDSENAPWAKNWKIKSSFLQKIPILGKKHEFFPPIAPFAWRRFDFSPYDLVISVTSSEAKGVRVSGKTIHICYCLTPTRYFWSGYFEYLRRPGFGSLNMIVRGALAMMAYILRVIDFYDAQRPNILVGISDEVCKRIKTFYRRDSFRIYPPVSPIAPAKALKKEGNYFLVVSRLVPYKHIEIAVEACTELGLPLKVVGTGNDLKHLKSVAGSSVEFLGFISDAEMATYYENCIAVIFPTNEDFGIVPVEAQLFGKPVVAFRGGGALETVTEGETGVFFDEQTKESLIGTLNLICGGVAAFDSLREYFLQFDPEICVTNGKRFSKERFQNEFKQLVNESIETKSKTV
jgi:glycosyltransferase involved in cell wall biosynthesis